MYLFEHLKGGTVYSSLHPLDVLHYLAQREYTFYSWDFELVTLWFPYK